MLHHANRASLATSRDPNFDYVTLLLHGDGTNGGQNNTFTDSSGNNYTLTRNGNPTQGTFSPYGTLWSNYFDGTDDYLSVADNAAMRPGAGAFTLEAWIFRNASGVAHTIYAKGGASTGIVFQVTSGNVLRFTHTTTNIDSTGTIADNTWTHVSVVREGTGTNQTKLYINGIQDGQGTVSTDFTQTEEVRIGTNRSAGEDFSGYISNLRFVKGTAVYTANFTPPTEPLTAITNTSLLTCQSNRLIDNSSNAFTITRNGNVSIQRFSPFNPPGEYSNTIISGSGYFDGTGDYLSVADAAALRFGTGNFTIQAWIYRSVAGVTHSIAGKGDGSLNTGWSFVVTNTNVLRFAYSSSNLDTTTTIPAGVWTHVAVVREGTGTNQLKLYINGVQSAQGTVSTNFNQTNILYFGANRAAAGVFNGYLANIKYNVGTAETITVPTAPVTGGTILLDFTNASIIDNAMMNNLETVGNAQISTSVSRFGTGSLAFDGTGDYCVMPTAIDLQMGGGNFTWECWFYPLSLPAASTYETLWAQRATSTGFGGPLVVMDSSGNYRLFIANAAATTWQVSDFDTTLDVTLNAWQHLALVKNGSSIVLYKDGVAGSSTTHSVAVGTSGSTSIGAGSADGIQVIHGYIDDLRITRGISRYTANFTPRNTPFPNM